jgi:hemerythrin-like domain-containing protein
MRVSELLRQEHKIILRTLVVLEAIGARVNHGATVNLRDARDIVALLKGFADRHHQGKEEAVLFPALLRDPHQEHYGKLCCLIFEHDQERSLIDGLEEAVESGNTREFLFCANRIVERTRAHIHREDNVLLNLTDSVLSPLDDERVASELREFEHSWQIEVLPNLLNRLEELESEYTKVVHPESATAR